MTTDSLHGKAVPQMGSPLYMMMYAEAAEAAMKIGGKQTKTTKAEARHIFVFLLCSPIVSDDDDNVATITH